MTAKEQTPPVPTDEQIAKELAQGRASFDRLHQQMVADNRAYWSDPNNPEVSWGEAEDIAFMRRSHETRSAYLDLVDKAIKLMESTR